MIIAEIGLNHLGDSKYAYNYVQELVKSVDAITFQIREPEFYKDSKFSKYILSDANYNKLIKYIHSKNKKVGIAICDASKINFFINSGIDFFKILSKDIDNYELLKEINKTKKPIFLSTGLSNIVEIKKTIKFFNKKSNLSLIHTQLSHNIHDVNLNSISKLKTKLKLPIAYGHHSDNILVMYLALCFIPSDIFFYVRGVKKSLHPDQKHAIPLSKVNKIIKNFILLPHALGSGEKQKMFDLINK
jgi:N,N'-diacetyllegionaminate synthase